MVRERRLDLPYPKVPDPKSGASANSATLALAPGLQFSMKAIRNTNLNSEKYVKNGLRSRIILQMVSG